MTQNIKTVPTGEIPDGWMGLDIGEETRKQFADAIKGAKPLYGTGLWAYLNLKILQRAQRQLQKTMASIDATTIIGGGDSAAAVNQLGYGDKMTHISTGGGASLEFLRARSCPALLRWMINKNL